MLLRFNVGFNRAITYSNITTATISTLGTVSVKGQEGATFAGPSVKSGWITVDNTVSRDIPGDDRACPDQCMTSDCVSADDGGVCSDACSLPHSRHCEIAGRIARKCATRRQHIGENHRWPTEDIVFQRYTLVHGNVVLYLHAITNANARPDDNILADSTVFADPCALQNMREMPDHSTIADVYALIDIRRLMHKKLVLHVSRHSESLHYA